MSRDANLLQGTRQLFPEFRLCKMCLCNIGRVMLLVGHQSRGLIFGRDEACIASCPLPLLVQCPNHVGKVRTHVLRIYLKYHVIFDLEPKKLESIFLDTSAKIFLGEKIEDKRSSDESNVCCPRTVPITSNLEWRGDTVQCVRVHKARSNLQ